MSFQKFIDLIINSHLYFSLLAELSDKYEGTLPKLHFKKSVTNVEHEVLNTIALRLEELKNSTFINCWTMKKHESFALWKIYSGLESGVAIKTTVSRLENAINFANPNKKNMIIISKVKYKDYLDKPTSPFIEASITKKNYYDFEDEVRLINTQFFSNKKEVPKNLKEGSKIPVDLNKLIDSIYFSPHSHPNFKENSALIIKKFRPGLERLICDSNIREVK